MVAATFSEAMNSATIDATSYIVKQGAKTIAGTYSYSGNTATFNPSVNFLPNTTYTATINTKAKNLAGTSLAKTYIWNFTTTGPFNPIVTSTNPENLATGVGLNQVVSATFNENMDPSSLSSSTFTLYNGSTSISGVVTYANKVASFTPTVALLSGIKYTATIKTGAKNATGAPLANDYIWSFTTGVTAAPEVISTDPIDKATKVSIDKVITADFSEKMDPTSISASTFSLKEGTNKIAVTVWYSGKTATFKPNVALKSGVTYTATITKGVTNVAGVSLTKNYIWTFSTDAPKGPNGPDLKSVARFGIISGVGVSNNAGFSKINNMDVGIYPGTRSSITGFPPAKVVNGAIYASDDVSPAGVAAMLLQAKTDLTAAYLYAEGATSPAPATVSGDQGGKTLAPGIYKSTSTLMIQSGDLTLDAQGDANAVWIFQIASAFTTVGGSGGNIILSGGAQAKNVYWQVGTSATIGSYTKFKGNVLALTSITMGAYSTAVGRMLARNGAVVMTSTNTIDKP